ncbi:hypothetical protein quinque_007636 [Culex quinquefasciatus]
MNVLMMAGTGIVTFFLLLVAAVAFLAAFQPAVEAAPQDVARAEVAAPEARQEGSDGKPEGAAAAAADGPTLDGGKKGHGKGGKGGKVCDKGAKGKGQANKENGAKGHANKGKEQGKGKN